jgi:hypothetical protein
MKRIENTVLWTDGKINYKKNSAGELVLYVEQPEPEPDAEDGEDNWCYNDQDFVQLDEPVTLKPIDKS